MSYRVSLDAQARDFLAALPRDLRLHLAAELTKLAEHPAAHSRPAHFPYPLDGQLFETKCSLESQEHFITLMFKYSADEQSIFVLWVTHRQRALPG